MNTRIGVRISSEIREQIQNAISEGKAKSLSDFVKQAIREKLGSSFGKSGTNRSALGPTEGEPEE